MNWPNRLTIARTVLIPFYLVFLMLDLGISGSNYIAAAIFVIASFTDFLDGRIARKYNQVTNFGKFMDPLADKLLVCSALIAFIDLHRIPAWIVIIIIAREFIISGFRLVAADAGIVIAASMWGKVKTTVQMIMIIVLTLNFEWMPFIEIIEAVLIYASLILTVVSLVDYIAKNIKVITDNESAR